MTVNPYKAEVPLAFPGGREVALVMTWGRMAALNDHLGGDTWDEPLQAIVEGAMKGQREPLRQLAEVVAILARDPITAAEVIEASPGIQAINAALQQGAIRFFHGAEPVPDPLARPSETAKIDQAGLSELLRRFGSPLRTAFRQGNSGA